MLHLGKKCQITLIFLLTFGLLFNIPVGFTKESPENMSYGINFLSTHWHYDPYYLSDNELERDFSLFQKQGLDYITLVAVWKYIEPATGIYNDEALDDLVRVCNFAEKYKLKVIIDFHTLMHENSFTMPEWLNPRKFEAIFYDNNYRQNWLNYLDYCTSYLKEVKNIHSWHMMNEPALKDWACDVTIDDFIDLWIEMKTVIKKNSDKPISIRFGADTFDAHFERDPRIYQICDYLSLNWYEKYCSRELLEDILKEVQGHSIVTISEFGFESNDDNTQLDQYHSMIDLFKNLKVKNCFAWLWRADHNMAGPDLPGQNFNLAKNINGKPRPAFYLLGNQKNAEIFRWLYSIPFRLIFLFNGFK